MDKADFCKQEFRKTNSKLRKKQSDLIKKINQKTGSYDLNTADYNESFENEEILNDNIELNLAEPIREYDEHAQSTRFTSFAKSTSLLNSTNATSSVSNNNRNSTRNNSHLLESLSSIEFPKKATLLGIPLLCCTYLAAIYSMLAYGATSLLSIVELMMNNTPTLLPLYLLLAGYLLITLMSFLLIVAIQKEHLNLILFWIISLSVFILPEIGLNIVLANNSFDWFNSSTGFYTLVALVVRVTIDLPCIGIILAYHVNRTKRNNFLRNMLKPLKRNIMNGEVLKSYNNLKIDPNSNSNTNYPVVETMPLPQFYDKNSDTCLIGFNQRDNASDKSDSNISSTLSNASTSSQEHEQSSEFEQEKNTYYFKFAPGSNYEIQVRPSKTGQFVQRFVNIDDIKINRNLNNEFDPYKANSSSGRKQSPIKLIKSQNIASYKTEQLENSKYFDKETRPKNNRISYMSLEKNLEFTENDVSIPIEFESNKNRNLREEYLNEQKYDFNNQSQTLKSDQEMQEEYLSLKKNRKTLNVSNHQIYLPPASSMIQTPRHEVIYSENGNGGDSQNATCLRASACNCVNIASCTKDKINEFIHSKDCILVNSLNNTSNSNSSMNVSNLDLFIQRKHF